MDQTETLPLTSAHRPPTARRTILVAVDGSDHSKYSFKWSLGVLLYIYYISLYIVLLFYLCVMDIIGVFVCVLCACNIYNYILCVIILYMCYGYYMYIICVIYDYV
jgi:hypothetical protein